MRHFDPLALHRGPDPVEAAFARVRKQLKEQAKQRAEQAKKLQEEELLKRFGVEVATPASSPPPPAPAAAPPLAVK